MATKESVYADLEGLPTSLGGGEIYSSMKPISTGVDLPASESDRKFKKKYDTENIVVTTDGFTIFVSLEGAVSFEEEGGNAGVKHQRTPTTYFKFTIGETPTYSFYFGPDAPSYGMLAESIKVEKIIINKKTEKVDIVFPGSAIEIKNKKFRFDIANKTGTDGFMFQEGGGGYSAMFFSVAPYNQKTVNEFNTCLADKESAKNLGSTVLEMNKNGEGVYIWNADSVKVYYESQSFTFNADLDKEFLVAPKADYKGIGIMDTTNQFIKFNCIIENTALRTNNYTGYDPQDPSTYFTTIQFPGDESLLAPMGTSDEGTEVACGLEAPEGRVLKSIKPVIVGTTVQQVKLEFHDGSFCVFPDAETGMFTATDKETGQVLQGRVDGLMVAKGNPIEAHTKEMINRISNNIDTNLTLTNKGESVTSAIAWTTTNPKAIKIIVPTDKGSKLITIPLKGA